MKITCLQENLLKGLAITAHAVSTSSPAMTTRNVLMEADKGRLKLTATNLEISITTWIGAQIEGDTPVNVPAHMLSDYVKLLPEDQVFLELSDSGMLNISCGGYSGHINTMDPGDFQPIPEVNGDTVTIPAQPFKEVLGRIVDVASKDNVRPILTGVKVELEPEKLNLAAADGYRLATDSMGVSEGEGPENPLDVIIPAKTLQEVEKIIGEYVETVNFTIAGDRSRALFKIGDSVEVVTQLLQGEYPDYRRLIPTEHVSSLKVDAGALRRAVEAASVFAKGGNQVIRLVASTPDGDKKEASGRLKVSATSEGAGESEIELQVTVDGEDAKIAFNHRFLQDMTRAVSTGEIVLNTNSSSGPGVFRSTDDESYVHVIMPMHVQW